jgi:hypothetical protein
VQVVDSSCGDGYEPEGREFESLRARQIFPEYVDREILRRKRSGFRLAAPARRCASLTPLNASSHAALPKKPPPVELVAHGLC